MRGPATRRPLARLTWWVPIAVACALASLTSCANHDENRRVLVRLVDSVHAKSAATAGSTAMYPWASIGDDTRPVLADGVGDDTPAPTRASFNVQVPADARLEFGYALRAPDPSAAPVTFGVSARQGDSVDKIFEREIAPGSADANVWHDLTIDLVGLSGDTVLELSTATAAGGAGAVGRQGAAAYFADPVITVPAAESEAAQPRSVILISIDTLRADHLGIYGYARETTPSIDRMFSAQGIVVERFYTNAADTLRGHAAMLSGYLPTTALAPAEPVAHVAPWVLTLAERLRASGYRTAAFTEDASLGAAAGFARGFERFQEATATASAANTPGFVEQTFGRGLAWIDEHKSEPFFVFLQTDQVHAPYDPPQNYAGLFPVRPDASAAVADAAAYDREIRYTDDQLGILTAALTKLGVLDRALLIITSDHGEEFGEHGRRLHGTNLHDEVLRIPLLLRAPSLLPAGVRRSGPMALADLVPTLCTLLGLPKPEQVDGQDLSAHLVQNAATDPVAIYHEGRAPAALTYAGKDEAWLPPSFALTTWPRRLIRILTPEGARYELYDLSKDPAETRNVDAGRRPALGFLRARLDRYDEFRSQQRDVLGRKLSKGAAEPQALPP